MRGVIEWGQRGLFCCFLTALGVGYAKLGENEVMVDLLLLRGGAQGSVRGASSRLQGRNGGDGDVLVDHRGDRYG
jgi:hypothetical protein